MSRVKTFDCETDNGAELKERRKAAVRDVVAGASRIATAADRLGDSEYGDALKELADEAAKLAERVRALAERE